ncbi:Protoporphyrinogen oxidase [Cyberlindnera fabianii]|uniref:Protoporphyrinogen oxidase n=1 Tax=Cyberlindnera fabianii TaxID=36022 RepID=A0A1V2LBF0_CYBFA|nr:Protoporphyrinogen oxidase [Cyberlindnera fabianii]
MSLRNGARIAVVGTGVSGLSFAHFLTQLRPDLHITLYDASSRPGGYIYSQLHNINGNNVLLEKGPRTLRGASDGTVMIADTLLKLGEDDKIKVIPSSSISNKKYLLSPRDELIQVPNSFASFRKFVQSPLGKGLVSGFVKEPLQKSQHNNDESVSSFLGRRFGESLPQNVISAVFHGVYAADIGKLSAKTTLKSMFEAEKEHGSIVKSMLVKTFQKKPPADLSETLKDYESRLPSCYSISHLSQILKKFPMLTFEGGLETFPKTIYKQLATDKNIDFKFNTPVESISNTDKGTISINGTTYDHIHTTINASGLSRAIPQTKTASLASKLTYIDIHMINIYVPSHILKHTGFGYLVPMAHDNPKSILGVIFDSDVEKGSIPLFKNNTHLTEGTHPELNPEYKDQDYTKLTVMMGGHFWSESGRPTDLEKTTKDALLEVEKHLGVKFSDDCYIDHSYIPQCLPQYHVGYESLKKQFGDAVKEEFNGKLTFGGMSFGDGAGVPDCVSNAYKNAVALA